MNWVACVRHVQHAVLGAWFLTKVDEDHTVVALSRMRVVCVLKELDDCPAVVIRRDDRLDDFLELPRCRLAGLAITQVLVDLSLRLRANAVDWGAARAAADCQVADRQLAPHPAAGGGIPRQTAASISPARSGCESQSGARCAGGPASCANRNGDSELWTTGMGQSPPATAGQRMQSVRWSGGTESEAPRFMRTNSYQRGRPRRQDPGARLSSGPPARRRVPPRPGDGRRRAGPARYLAGRVAWASIRAGSPTAVVSSRMRRSSPSTSSPRRDGLVSAATSVAASGAESSAEARSSSA